MKYAPDGDQQFNALMESTLAEIGKGCAQALGNNMVALVLGGGYGRGEGGIVMNDGRQMPYNDLDFTLIVERPDEIKDAMFRDLVEPFEEQLTIEIDFSRPLTPADIRTWPHCLMWKELLEGHVVVSGDPEALRGNAPAYMLDPLPAIEATRLLLNRGAGLLWARRIEVGKEQAPDPDFIRRNYYKCALAMGDALLIAWGEHQTAYRGRCERLEQLVSRQSELQAFEWLLPLYRDAMTFKMRPDDIEEKVWHGDGLLALAGHWISVFLAVEEKRTGTSWQDAEAYCQDSRLREPGQHRGKALLRNVVHQARRGKLSWRYPREELYRILPWLIAAPTLSDPWLEQSASFLACWQRYN